MVIAASTVFAVSAVIFFWLAYLWHAGKTEIELPEILLGLTGFVYVVLFFAAIFGFIR